MPTPSSDTSIRTVGPVESWGAVAVNNTYCVYGRSSNSRACDDVYSSLSPTTFGVTVLS
jgi:hypothetical protein